MFYRLLSWRGGRSCYGYHRLYSASSHGFSLARTGAVFLGNGGHFVWKVSLHVPQVVHSSQIPWGDHHPGSREIVEGYHRAAVFYR